MDKFDLRSARLISIIIVMLLMFAIVVIKAYDYLPENTKNIIESVEENNDIELENNESEVLSDEINSEEHAEDSKVSNKNINRLEIISDEDLNSNSNLVEKRVVAEKNFSSVFEKAKELKKEKSFAAAISEFQNAVSISDSNKEKAQCYEEIAYIFAVTKRYGTALSYAQKAYNLAPTNSREILLARLYYQTGDIEKATVRVNNVLKRDFLYE